MEGPCSWYWSSSPVEDDEGYAFCVGFGGGYVDSGYVTKDRAVRCVR